MTRNQKWGESQPKQTRKASDKNETIKQTSRARIFPFMTRNQKWGESQPKPQRQCLRLVIDPCSLKPIEKVPIKLKEISILFLMTCLGRLVQAHNPLFGTFCTDKCERPTWSNNLSFATKTSSTRNPRPPHAPCYSTRFSSPFSCRRLLSIAIIYGEEG